MKIDSREKKMNFFLFLDKKKGKNKIKMNDSIIQSREEMHALMDEWGFFVDTEKEMNVTNSSSLPTSVSTQKKSHPSLQKWVSNLVHCTCSTLLISYLFYVWWYPLFI